MSKEFSVAIPLNINSILLKHLIRKDNQEDLCFALYAHSEGKSRTCALINEIIFPETGDHQVHGNVSFNEQFFKRVCRIAIRRKMGVCFIHSHPYPGWQCMSSDDIRAETKMAPTVFTLTGLPLVGLTVGNDGTWSGRSWGILSNGNFKKNWASLVKIIGVNLKVHFNDNIKPIPSYRKQFKRTRTVYGDKNHQQVSRLRIGIVGLGSVGSILAETLARMGFRHFVLIDFDKIEEHNLDRQLGSTEADIGEYKVIVGERLIRKSGTSELIEISAIKDSIAKPNGYRAALDCDVLFSCVDRPWPRYILNHLAYAHLIPVIDGGIKIKFKDAEFETAEWQLQTATVGKPCLQCLGVYEPSEVDMERMGKLDDPSYLQGLPSNHHFKANENIFPFSANLASMEVFQYMALTTGLGESNFGIQRYRFVHGFISNYTNNHCKEGCQYMASIATGDVIFNPSN